MFDASYDAWGRQTVTQNDIDLHYGYCGHEMLPFDNLIDMGGRVYDSAIGRFLSCDNYVQEPDNSQNFNRYSYCLNNPLRYTDPTGEFWHLVIGAAIGGIINWATHGGEFSFKGLGYFGVGALAGAVSAGLASGVNVAMAGTSFWDGALGLAGGVSSTGFLSGAASGASAGFAGGFISGMGNSLLDGTKFGLSIISGLKSGGMGALGEGLAGGILGGFDSLDKGCNFWDGTIKSKTTGAYACKGCLPSDIKLGDYIVAKYKGQFEGQNVFESRMLGKYSETGGYSGFTLPDKGIFVGDRVFSQRTVNGLAMMQHEFGHVLQYRKVGSYAYYKVIAAESLSNCIFDRSFRIKTHDVFWTETWANYLSKRYFGDRWLGLETIVSGQSLRYYPSEKMGSLFLFLKFGPMGLSL